ncbi:MAG TPA: hypothetical protein PKE29_16430 [Phycisphaerales bacterium]|nr:hypothetical protein [Phycisphaerales bacterium]
METELAGLMIVDRIDEEAGMPSGVGGITTGITVSAFPAMVGPGLWVFGLLYGGSRTTVLHFVVTHVADPPVEVYREAVAIRAAPSPLAACPLSHHLERVSLPGSGAYRMELVEPSSGRRLGGTWLIVDESP